MARPSPREELTERVTNRLVSLGTDALIAKAREQGFDDVIPPTLDPSQRWWLDPKTGHLYTRRAVQTAKTFHTHPLQFRSMREATPERARRERALDDAGLTFPARDWEARRERDARVKQIETLYDRKQRRTGKLVPGRFARYESGTEFREALARLSPPVPSGTKQWVSLAAQRRKTRALEVLGMRPRGFVPLTGEYTAEELAAAWAAAGQRAPRLARQ